MKISNAETGPQMTLDISPGEREIALKVKKNFVKSLDHLDAAIKVIVTLKDSIAAQRPSKKDIANKYKGKLIRYRKKIKEAFNTFLVGIRDNIEMIAEISDPEMIKLREVLISELNELSDGAEAIMALLTEPDKEGFTKTLEQITNQMLKRQKSIKDVIDSQFVSHIDQDILGKMKLSNIRFNIKKRARVIKQLIEG